MIFAALAVLDFMTWHTAAWCYVVFWSIRYIFAVAKGAQETR